MAQPDWVLRRWLARWFGWITLGCVVVEIAAAVSAATKGNWIVTAFSLFIAAWAFVVWRVQRGPNRRQLEVATREFQRQQGRGDCRSV